MTNRGGSSKLKVCLGPESVS